jgi:hypothetical protein
VQTESKVEIVLREYQEVAGDRATWEAHWQEIAERCLPAYSNTFTPNSYNTPGQKKTEKIFDSTAQVALGRFASVVDSLSTPMTQKWHRLRASDPYLNKLRPVREFFEAVTDALFKYRYMPKANFTGQIHEVWQGLGAFGTGILFTDELRTEPGLRYKAMHLGEVYLFENHQGVIDKALRRFSLTARQARQRWGDKLPETIKGVQNQNQKFWFLHRVAPNDDRDPGRYDAKGMAYSSCYVSETGKVLLEEGGYNSFPYQVSRYKTLAGETYGRGPGMDVLPAMKTLNEQKKTLLKQGHRAVDPVLLVHDDGILDVSLLPGAINYGGVDAQGRRLVHELPVGNIAIGKDMMDDERAVINDAFLVTLFQVLVESPQMTATEVLERTREKGVLLAPTVGRQQSEFLGPLIEREIDVLSRQGLLPPMPPELREARGQYETIYDSPLSRAMRAEEAAGFWRAVEKAGGVANLMQDPSPLDHFDFDVAIPELAEIEAVPLRWLRSMDQITVIREGRAEQAEQQTMIEAAPAAASVVKSMAAMPAKQA